MQGKLWEGLHKEPTRTSVEMDVAACSTSPPHRPSRSPTSASIPAFKHTTQHVAYPQLIAHHSAVQCGAVRCSAQDILLRVKGTNCRNRRRVESAMDSLDSVD